MPSPYELFLERCGFRPGSGRFRGVARRDPLPRIPTLREAQGKRGHSRSITAAIACPCPMHIVASP